MRFRLRAFTLVEVMVMLAVVTLLTLALTPALTRTKPTGYAVQCLYNLRQLGIAGQMYAHDYNDRFVVNLHGGEALGGAGDPAYGVGWAEGWLDWSATRPDNTNLNFLINRRYAKFAPYINGATNLFKCPADNFLSDAQRAAGWSRRVRSYSASLAIGPGNAGTGPWDSIYRQVVKMSDLVYPSPAETFIYLEEHPDSINDPGFFSPYQMQCIDLPSTLHNGAGALSFADGHVELHRWTACLAVGRAKQVLLQDSGVAIVAPAGDTDIHWLSYHTQRKSTNSF